MATEKEASLHGPDGLLDQIGNAISWIWLLLIAVIVTAVILRFVFGVGFIQRSALLRKAMIVSRNQWMLVTLARSRRCSDPSDCHSSR